jgi:hypothetical protein
VPACTPTTQTYLVSADAWIDQGSSSSNKGADSILKVQGKSGNSFRSLVQFTLPAVPQGCGVQAATLRLYAPSYKDGRTLEAWQVAASWTENDVTWDNQPGTTGSPATAPSGSGYREWNVTSQIQSMYATASNYGFLIRDASEDDDGFEQQFHSREKGETIPELIISFGPVQ